MRKQHPKDGSTHQINIKLHSPKQLFNTFDPSPFHEKDLDLAAERYIINAVDEHALKKPLHLVIHLPEQEISVDMADQFREAIQGFFSYRANEAKHQLRRCFRDGRIALFVGLCFLLTCLLLRELLIPHTQGFVFRLLSEGFLIIGWVALWYPLDIFLYHWWPLLRRYRLLKKISRLSVELAPFSSTRF